MGNYSCRFINHFLRFLDGGLVSWPRPCPTPLAQPPLPAPQTPQKGGGGRGGTNKQTKSTNEKNKQTNKISTTSTNTNHFLRFLDDGLVVPGYPGLIPDGRLLVVDVGVLCLHLHVLVGLVVAGARAALAAEVGALGRETPEVHTAVLACRLGLRLWT